MSDKSLRDRLPSTRRGFLMATLGGAVGGAAALTGGDKEGNIYGGQMALDRAYKIAEGDRALYQGPDSAKGSFVPNDGDRYEAVDTQVAYYGDGGTWKVLGIGSSSQSVPSVTTDEIRNVADYIVDASDDLDDVLNNQVTAEDNVYVGAGAHEYKNIERDGVDDVTVIGERGSEILLSSDADGGANVDDRLVTLKNCSGWRFIGLTFDGNSSGLSGYDSNNEQALNGLTLANCEDIKVLRCTFQNVRQNGILLTAGTRNCLVANNTFENNRTHILSYDIDIDSVASASSHHNTIKGNLLKGTVTGMTAGNPIAIYCSGGTHSSIIENNTIKGKDELERGIQILNTYNTVATSNQIHDTLDRGIAISAGASNNGVGWNQINCPKARPLYAEDNTGPSGGIHENNILAFNTIEGAETNAIDLRHGTAWWVLGNVVVDPDQRGLNAQANVGDGAFAYNIITGPGQDIANRAVSISQGTWLIGPNVINDTLSTLNVSIGIDSGATDVGIDRQIIVAGPRDIADSGTRTRYQGVIGGGPLGGVDISTVTGASTGDLARTTGASAAGADVIAVFDGSGWVYPTRGGTVTPA